ncbi:hypothetical protein DPMN_004017 [Dreissena polymorpha]|uniref:Uncharacterized protein n=1 Tax=Dreissena polymorpha TaxID=45954 RepID=A0A9D4MQT8_DREPO|nr:hypothetical protein DPMN_004017 [Dreissena polymorpha]
MAASVHGQTGRCAVATVQTHTGREFVTVITPDLYVVVDTVGLEKKWTILVYLIAAQQQQQQQQQQQLHHQQGHQQS